MDLSVSYKIAPFLKTRKTMTTRVWFVLIAAVTRTRPERAAGSVNGRSEEVRDYFRHDGEEGKRVLGYNKVYGRGGCEGMMVGG